MKYRSRADIAAAILNTSRQGAKKTQLMYGAFLSFPQIEEYLDLLVEQDLIRYIEIVNKYYTTEKGFRFLKMYNEVGWMIFPRGAMQHMSANENKQQGKDNKKNSVAL